ncbi:MAG: hypothetical protein ACJ74H_08145 [Thermoanaerobaculia bacterium]
MKTIAAIALTLCAATLVAQPKPVEVKIQQVNDRRTNGSFSRLTIELELPKIKSSEVEASRVFLTAATDDSGKSLLDPEASEPQLEPNFHRPGAPENPPAPASVSVTLANPDRKATVIREVRGEIELYMPGKDPNSVAEIAKFVSSAGKPLAHKALKANGVEIALLTPTQIEAERKRVIDAKRKEYKDAGWEDGESLEETLKNTLESTLTLEESDLLVRVKDPNQRLQDLVYVDAAGEEKRISTRGDEGLVYFSTWEGKPQPDWKLRVSMKTPKNMVRHSFALKDVTLP